MNTELTKKTIELLGTTVEYEIKKSKRSKRTGLVMYPDGRIVATIPWYRTEFAARRFVLSKSEWIVKNLSKVKHKNIVIVPTVRKNQIEKYRKEARSLIEPRVRELAMLHGFTYKKMTFKNMKTQWGSCSSRGNLNFNLRLVFLRQELIDYVIIHEMCHLKEHNHKRPFWNLVESKMPDYKKYDRELESYVLK